jgi:hypothetical protein
MKADQIIEKFQLRRQCSIRGVMGQKMDEAAIQRFIESDPSGTGKYLEWMFYQAGGGKIRLDKSVQQWEKGDNGEPCVRDQLKERWIKDELNGWKDEKGVYYEPKPKEQAEAEWPEVEKRLRLQHVYGDEEYTMTGFGFYRSWPGANSLYDSIVQAVKRFHRYQQSLKAKNHSIDLNLANYPNLRELNEVLKDITILELKNDAVLDIVYNDDSLVVNCPFNIGASLKAGIPKWCTSNESMFTESLFGTGQNRWKEHASVSALYYCRFKGVADEPTWKFVAIQIPFEVSKLQMASDKVKYWDAADASHSLKDFMSLMTSTQSCREAHMTSFRKAMDAIAKHFAGFPRDRMILDFVVKA